MVVRTKIWNDLLDSYKGDSYLVSYISVEKNRRKIFRIITIVLSASGIFSVFKQLPIPTVISFTIIGIIQILQSIENFIIHSDKDLDELKKLRLMYNEKNVRLEKVWIDLDSGHITELLAKKRLFDIMDFGKKIEEVDSCVNIKLIRKLDRKAEMASIEYSQKLSII